MSTRLDAAAVAVGEVEYDVAGEPHSGVASVASVGKADDPVAGAVDDALGWMWLEKRLAIGTFKLSPSRRLKLVCQGRGKESRPLERQKTRSIERRVC